jgi:hypothetical protein
MTRRTALWLIAALLGILASAAVAWTASRLAGQRIGLSSAPLSVSRGLAPAGATERRSTTPGSVRSDRRPAGKSTPAHPLTRALPPPLDDSSGSAGSGADD